MSDPIDKGISVIELALLVGVILILAWSGSSLLGLFKGIDKNDPTGIKEKANNLGLKASQYVRNTLSGTDDSGVSDEEYDNLGLKSPNFTWKDLLPNWLNTATWSIEPESVDQYSDGEGVTGSW